MNWKLLTQSEEGQTMLFHFPCPRPGQTLLINLSTPAKPDWAPESFSTQHSREPLSIN